MARQQKSIRISRRITQKHYFIEYIHSHYSQPTIPGMMICEPVRGAFRSQETKYHAEIDTSYQRPIPSDLVKLVDNLRKLIDIGSLSEISKLLKDNFICDQFSEKEKHNIIKDCIDECCIETITTLNYETRLNIEALVLDQEMFNHILKHAEEVDNRKQTNIRWFILQQLQYLQFEDDEAADFRKLNLEGASFENAKLGISFFSCAKLTNVNFKGCDLQNTDISQEQLDGSLSYESAEIPEERWGWWSDDFKQQLLNQLEKIHSYAKVYIPKEHPKHEKIDALYAKYLPILSSSGNPSAKTKQQMLNELEKAQNELRLTRNLGYLIKEMIACIFLMGVGYGALVVVNAYKTGYYGLFPPKTFKATHSILQLMQNQVHCPQLGRPG